MDLLAFNQLIQEYGPLFVGVIVWSLAWKGVALWKAARSGSRTWFVALLVLNTFGLLEIIYIYFFSKGTPPTKA
jgi:hypothetical protein